MAMTKQIPREQWGAYFDRFTRQHLQRGVPEEANLELVSPTLGDQIEGEGATLLGLTWDPKSEAFEVLLEGVDRMHFHPSEIWVVEDRDGFLTAVELVDEDGEREILRLRRSSAMEIPYPAS
jgi:hypothetical protein